MKICSRMWKTIHIKLRFLGESYAGLLVSSKNFSSTFSLTNTHTHVLLLALVPVAMGSQHLTHSNTEKKNKKESRNCFIYKITLKLPLSGLKLTRFLHVECVYLLWMWKWIWSSFLINLKGPASPAMCTLCVDMLGLLSELCVVYVKMGNLIPTTIL